MMADILENPFWFVFYVIGVLSVVFHFANGLWSFMITWGITQSPKSQQVMSYVAIIVFVIVGFIGRSEEHTSELQSRLDLVCRLLLEKKKNNYHERITDSHIQ